MKQKLFSALVVVALASSLLAGCGGSDAQAPVAASSASACVDASARAGKHVYVFTGDEVKSRVERASRSDGSEVLSGETTIARDAGTSKVIELVEIDREGRLVYADVSVITASGARRMLLDAARGMMFVQDAQRAAWQRVATDAPWVYAASEGQEALSLLPTPVSAWVAARAAEGGADVRMVDGARRTSALVARDQLVLETGEGERVAVAGSAAITLRGEFVTAIGVAHVEQPAAPVSVAPTHRPPRRLARR
jgi:hypothetical protein